MLPPHLRTRGGQRTGAAQPLRGRGGTRQARGRRAVPRASRRSSAPRALHPEAPGCGASETGSCHHHHPSALRTNWSYRGASEVELHPATTARSKWIRCVITIRLNFYISRRISCDMAIPYLNTVSRIRYKKIQPNWISSVLFGRFKITGFLRME